MVKRRLTAVLALCPLLLHVPVPAAAADEALDTYTLPDVYVVAETVRADTVIDVAGAASGTARTVPELLREAAGLQVQQRPNSGGNEDLTVKLRGHDSRHYTVLVDGVPMAGGGVMGGGYVDWTALPLNAVERIEITKGAKLAAWGGTLGGVINIVTKRSAASGGELQLSAGSNGRREYLLYYRGSDGGALGFSVYANKSLEDAYLRNSGYRDEQVGLGLSWRLNATDQLRFGVDHNDLKRGLVVANVPGTTGYNAAYPVTPRSDGFMGASGAGDGSYAEVLRNSFRISWDSQRANGSDTLTYWKNHEDRHEVLYVSGGLQFDRHSISDQSDGFLYTAARHLAGTHRLGYGLDYRRLRAGYGWYNVENGSYSVLYPAQKLDTLGLYLEDTWQLDRRWTGNIGLRYDQMRGDRDDSRAASVGSMRASALSPKFNFAFRNNDATKTSFSVNRIWRAPSMAEFYWHYVNWGFSQGMGLEPEKGWGYEISLEHRFSPRMDSKATLYYQDMDSYINFTHVSPFSCYNIPDVRLWGFEWESHWQLSKASNVFLNYTWQHTEKHGVDARDRAGLAGELDYRPRHVVSAGYTLDKDGWNLRYELNYTSSQRASKTYPAAASSDCITLGGYVIHSLLLTKDIGQRETLNLSVYNIFDRDYCEIYGYPMEGRVYTMTFSQKF